MQAVVLLVACMDDPKLRLLTQDDRDWLVDQHRILYARDEGFDDTFATLVAEIIDTFLATHDPAVERAWIAEQDGLRLGSVFCVKLDEKTAQLRLFLLVPEARGKGLGKSLLRNCMAYAKDKGYSGMRLWTHRSHEAACRLYQDFGWQCIDAKPDRHFGQDVVVETYTYDF